MTPLYDDATLRLIHLKQAGAMAAFAEVLEREGQHRAAGLADKFAAFYRRWAESPKTPPLMPMRDDRTCSRCGDDVQYLGSDDLCDACVAGDDEWHNDESRPVVCSDCHHNAVYHDEIGNCWHADDAGEEDCDCTALVELEAPRPGVTYRTEPEVPVSGECRPGWHSLRYLTAEQASEERFPAGTWAVCGICGHQWGGAVDPS